MQPARELVDRYRARRLKAGQLDDTELRDALERARELHERVTVHQVMTAKQQLRERIETLSEDEASEALRLLDLRTDPVIAAFLDAPVDDVPWTEDDEAAAAEGRADIAAERTVSLEQAIAESDE